MVVMVGIDVHKKTHCAVAVDEAGRQLGQPVTVRATDAGHRQLLRWAHRAFTDDSVDFAVEDCRHVSDRHRLARGGNRQLNAALHRIAVIRLDGLGRAYYQRRRANGDTTMEALRALERRLARIVFHLLRPTDTAAGTCLPVAA